MEKTEMMVRPKKLLFIKPNNASFIRQDEALFREHYRVAAYTFGSRKGLGMVWGQMRLFFWLLVRAPFASACFVWFADYHSFLPALFSRVFGLRCAIVIGGYDAESIPELNYGGHISAFRSRIIRWSCALAHAILPVSRRTWKRLNDHTGAKFERKFRLVYNAVDASAFEEMTPAGDPTKAGIVCVSQAATQRRLKIKGLDFLREVARAMPGVSFTLLGPEGSARKWLEADAPENLKITGPVPRAKLARAYRRAKVVCQFSRAESFGMTLAEGMLFGCVAVTFSDLGAAETASPDCGVIVEDRTVDAAVAALYEALAMPESAGIRARKRVLGQFSMAEREKGLLSALNP